MNFRLNSKNDGTHAPRVERLHAAKLASCTALALFALWQTAYAASGLTGKVGTVAGSGQLGYSSGPVARASKYNAPASVVQDRAGNRYIADSANCLLRKVDAAGMDSILAGTAPTTTAQCGFSWDGSKLSSVTFVALDPQERFLVFSEPDQCLVRKYEFASGQVSIIAGTVGVCGYAGDGGAAVGAQLNAPQGLAVDASGGIYVAEQRNCDVRYLQPNGTGYIISTRVGVGGPSGSNCSAASGTTLRSSIGNVQGIALDGFDRLFIVDASRHVIRVANPWDATLSIFAGADKLSGTTNGSASAARFNGLMGIAVEPSLSNPAVFVSETYATSSTTSTCRIRRIQSSTVATYAGAGCAAPSGDGSAPSNARFRALGALSLSPGGDLLIADRGNHQARVVFAAGAPNLSASAVASDRQAKSASDSALVQHLRNHGNDSTSGRWTQGDATYTLKLSDGRVLWLWGDSYLGGVSPTTNARTESDVMLENQISIQSTATATTMTNVWLKGAGQTSFVVPSHLRATCQRYWPSAATQVSSTLVQVVLRCVDAQMNVKRIDLANITINSGSTGWSVAIDETFTASALFQNVSCPAGTVGSGTVEYGTALVPVTSNGQTTTYVYGLGSGCTSTTWPYLLQGYVYVASVPNRDLRGTFTYYGNTGGSVAAPGSRQTRPGGALVVNAGAEYSVVYDASSTTPYRLVTSDYGIGNIMRLVATTPWGTWAAPSGQSEVVWKPREIGAPPYRGSGSSACHLSVYGAKEQPAFSDAQRLVLSYNVNVEANANDGDPNLDTPCEAGVDDLDILVAQKQNVDNYRPRFLHFTNAP